MAPAVLLLAQVALYVWMVPRGLELTDESYYLLNYLYWRDLSATVTFFGAYLEAPFRLLGQSVAAIRVVSLIGLLAAGAFFTREVLLFSRLREPASGSDARSEERGSLTPFALVGAAASLFYYGYFSSVRAPSYNWLALCAILIATALALRLATFRGLTATVRWTALSYGLVLGVCGLSKATTGLLMLLLHSLLFALANRDWAPRRIAEICALITAGVAVNVGLLQLADPHWLAVLREGVAMTNVIGHGGLRELGSAMIRDALSLTRVVLEMSAVAGGVVVLARNIRVERREQISVATMAVVGCLVLALGRSALRPLWLPCVALTTAVLWSFVTPWRRPSRWTRHGIAVLGLACVLFALPLAFSFGTNTAVFEHSQMAAVVAVVGVLMPLKHLSDARQITRLALGVSLALLCVPTWIVQFQNAFDAGHAYRLRTALVNQDLAARVGPASARLFLDSTTRRVLAEIDSAGHAAGFPVGGAVLDLTGDGPGVIYALGGRPLGVAWLSGGYSGSERAAARVISRLPLRELRSAWLLTSRDNPRRIVEWQRLLDQRAGAGTHELVATIHIRSAYVWSGDSPGPADVDLWRPRTDAQRSRAASTTPENTLAHGRDDLVEVRLESNPDRQPK